MYKIPWFLLITATLSLSSCIFVDDYAVAHEVYDKLIGVINSKNNTEIKNLFAVNIVNKFEDFDLQVDKMLDYIKGDYVSKNYGNSGMPVEYTINDMFTQARFLAPVGYELNSTESNYYISFYYCSIDDTDSNNIGIWNLRLQQYSEGEQLTDVWDSFDEWKNGDTYRGITYAN